MGELWDAGRPAGRSGVSLIGVGTFQAPAGRSPEPRTIGPGLQDIEILVGGRAFFDRPGLVVEAVPGTVLWHVAGQETVHRNDPLDPYRCVFLSFTWDGSPPPPRVSRWEDPTACRAFADEVLAAFHGHGPDREALGAWAYHTLRWRALAGEVSEAAQSLPGALVRARARIEADYAGPLSVADLASEAGVSVPHLHALFRRFGGQSPHQALMDRRMAEARRLLVATRWPVKEVAWAVGYPDTVTFCKVFRVRSGSSPARYRDQYTRRTGA